MKAALFQNVGKINVTEVDKPKIYDDEILLKVRAAAVCGTDLRIYKFGHFKIPENSNRVLGHEISGEIAEVGKNIKDYKVGMRVAVAPNVGCGKCNMCISGNNQLCPDYEAFGISYDGGFQEYMRIPAKAVLQGNVAIIPDSLSFEEAAIAEPFSCTYNSYRALGTKPGDTVVIIGAGPIGACHVMINKLAGAAKIIVSDVSSTRLEEIKKFGADVIVNSSCEDLAEIMKKESAGLGADVVITACSVPEVQQTALELAGAHGRINFFGGMPKGKEMVTLNTNLIHYKELIALGTTGSNIRDYYEAVKIAASGKVNLKDLATGLFSIDKIQDAFDYSLSGKGMKALIIFE